MATGSAAGPITVNDNAASPALSQWKSLVSLALLALRVSAALILYWPLLIDWFGSLPGDPTFAYAFGYLHWQHTCRILR